MHGRSANLCSKARFWRHFRFSEGPKNDPWSDIFNHPGGKNEVPRVTLTALWPTWARHATQNAPSMFFYRFVTVLGPIRTVFRRIFGGFPKNVQWISALLQIAFGIDFATFLHRQFVRNREPQPHNTTNIWDSSPVPIVC